MLILVVDDDSDVRRIIKGTLKDSLASASFIEAEDANQAIGICQDVGNRLALIICDFNMPNGSGDILFDYWKENFSYFPFILYSSEVLKAREKFQEKGDVDFERLGFVEKSQGLTSLICEVERLAKFGFLSIPTKVVTPTKSLKVPLFIGVNNKKIIKLCHEGDFLVQEKIDSFKEKGVIKLYVPMKEAVEKGLKFPLFPIHEVASNEDNPHDVFESFRAVHEELLNPFVHKKRSLELCLDSLSRNLTTSFPSEKIFSEFKKQAFFKKNYVVNHSLLVSTLVLMGLEEMGITNEGTRKTMVQSILIHDLLKTDSEAMESDLSTRNSDSHQKIKQNKYLFDIQSLLNNFEAGQDIVKIVECLVLGLHDPQYSPRGNHKLSSLALAVHRISNDLYNSGFTKKFEKEEFEEYSSRDKQVYSALEKVIKV